MKKMLLGLMVVSQLAMGWEVNSHGNKQRGTSEINISEEGRVGQEYLGFSGLLTVTQDKKGNDVIIARVQSFTGADIVRFTGNSSLVIGTEESGFEGRGTNKGNRGSSQIEISHKKTVSKILDKLENEDEVMVVMYSPRGVQVDFKIDSSDFVR